MSYLALLIFAAWAALVWLACQRGESRPEQPPEPTMPDSQPPMDLTLPSADPGPFRLEEYAECGRYFQVYESPVLSRVQAVASVNPSGMPWRIVRDGRLVEKCDGLAEVIEA